MARLSGGSRPRADIGRREFLLLSGLVILGILPLLSFQYLMQSTFSDFSDCRMNSVAGMIGSRSKYTRTEESYDRLMLQLRLLQAGIDATNETLDKIGGSWKSFAGEFGEKSVLRGLDSACEKYQRSVPRARRHIGVAGNFNSGTNLIYALLDNNCHLPGKAEDDDGVLWDVPWGKHRYVRDWQNHTRSDGHYYNRSETFVVLMIRDPYEWASSTCKHPYAIEWDNEERVKGQPCPRLVDNATDQLLPVFFENDDEGIIGRHESLIHFWNDWYTEYRDFLTEHPGVIARLEDAVLRPKEVVTEICHCAGGRMRKQFYFQTRSAKMDSSEDMGHGPDLTGPVQAWINLGRRIVSPRAGWSEKDYNAARRYIDSSLMEQLAYHHPKQK